MKKFVLFGFLFCFASGLWAQGVDLGIKAGANFANLSDVPNLNQKTGFLVGGFVAIKLGGFAIQPEVIYSQQGADSDFGNFDLDYVKIPVMFKGYILGSVLNLQIGPEFGFVVNDDLPSLGALGDKIDTKDYDLSGVVGVGLDFPVGLRFSLRYHYGFTDIGNNIDAKNRVLSLAVGYSFL